MKLFFLSIMILFSGCVGTTSDSLDFQEQAAPRELIPRLETSDCWGASAFAPVQYNEALENMPEDFTPVDYGQYLGLAPTRMGVKMMFIVNCKEAISQSGDLGELNLTMIGYGAIAGGRYSGTGFTVNLIGTNHGDLVANHPAWKITEGWVGLSSICAVEVNACTGAYTGIDHEITTQFSTSPVGAEGSTMSLWRVENQQVVTPLHWVVEPHSQASAIAQLDGTPAHGFKLNWNAKAFTLSS